MTGMGRRREPDGELVTTGQAELLRDADRRAAWMLLIDGVPQSHVDLDDPGYLDFEYVRRIGHVIDEAAPAGQPLRVLTWAPARSRWPVTWLRPGPARRSSRWRWTPRWST